MVTAVNEGQNKIDALEEMLSKEMLVIAAIFCMMCDLRHLFCCDT